MGNSEAAGQNHRISAAPHTHPPALFLGRNRTRQTKHAGEIIALITGVGGLIPFLVHKLLVKKKGYFESAASNIIIYLNVLAGIATFMLAALKLF
jgi:hypothetical protein